MPQNCDRCGSLRSELECEYPLPCDGGIQSQTADELRRTRSLVATTLAGRREPSLPDAQSVRAEKLMELTPHRGQVHVVSSELV